MNRGRRAIAPSRQLVTRTDKAFVAFVAGCGLVSLAGWWAGRQIDRVEWVLNATAGHEE